MLVIFVLQYKMYNNSLHRYLHYWSIIEFNQMMNYDISVV
jgi:hypothetical protein